MRFVLPSSICLFRPPSSNYIPTFPGMRCTRRALPRTTDYQVSSVVGATGCSSERRESTGFAEANGRRTRTARRGVFSRVRTRACAGDRENRDRRDRSSILPLPRVPPSGAGKTPNVSTLDRRDCSRRSPWASTRAETEPSWPPMLPLLSCSSCTSRNR